MDKSVCIVVGASHAGAQLAASLRQEGWPGRILVVSDESVIPYHRPPLSKGLLLGKQTSEQILIRPQAFYEKQNIEFMLDTKVNSIDRDSKLLTFANGDHLHYDKLALCTGARVRKLKIPGADQPNVFYLRTLVDVQRIQSAITSTKKSKKNIALIGGGYIGLEAAAAFRQQGHEVSVIEASQRILQRVTAPQVSDFYTKLHREAGVHFYLGKQVNEIKSLTKSGKDQLAIQFIDGETSQSEQITADIIVVGIGVIPNTELAEQAGLSVDKGILIDANGATNDENIVAAGDCCIQPNEIYQQPLHVESVPNAMEQAKVAAAFLCGKSKPINTLPWFWSDQYDVKLQIAGINIGYTSMALRGEPNSKSFVVWYFNQQQLVAADCVNRPKEFMFAKQLISNNTDVTREQLMDENVDLKTLL